MTAETIEIVAINDEASTCSRCGRTGLKRVAWVSVDGEEPVPYGTTCVWRVLKAGGHPDAEGRASWSKIEQIAEAQEVEKATTFLWSLPDPEVRGPVENEWGVEVYIAQVAGHEGRAVTLNSAIYEAYHAALRSQGFSYRATREAVADLQYTLRGEGSP